MGDRWLADLSDVCRLSGPVKEVGSGPNREGDAWKSRARRSGGYNVGQPSHVMVHHTASAARADGWSDVNYMCFNASTKPICNLYLDRAGVVWVCAGGATNTNGAGVDPCRRLDDDTMNASAIGIEAANDGNGEQWGSAQLDRYVTLVADLCEHYGIAVEQVHAHFEYAEGRKVDPAGPPRYAVGKNMWRMSEYRGDVADALHMPEPPTPPKPDPFPPIPQPIPGDDDMPLKNIIIDTRNGGVYVAGENTKAWCNNGDTAAQLCYRVMEAQGKTPDYTRAPDPFPTTLAPTARVAIDGYHYSVITHGDPHFIASFGPFVGPRPDDFDEYGR